MSASGEVETILEKATKALQEYQRIEDSDAPDEVLDGESAKIEVLIEEMKRLRNHLLKSGAPDVVQQIKQLDAKVNELEVNVFEDATDDMPASIIDNSQNFAGTSSSIPPANSQSLPPTLSTQGSLAKSTNMMQSTVDIPEGTLQSTLGNQSSFPQTTIPETATMPSTLSPPVYGGDSLESHAGASETAPETMEHGDSTLHTSPLATSTLPQGVVNSWINEQWSKSFNKISLSNKCTIHPSSSGLTIQDFGKLPQTVVTKHLSFGHAKLIPVVKPVNESDLFTIESRLLRVCMMEDDKLVSNVVTLPCSVAPNDPKLWDVTAQNHELLLRGEQTSTAQVCVELSVVYKHSDRRSVVSCGWGKMLFSGMRTGSLPLNGGTPLDKDVALFTEAPAQESKLKSLMSSSIKYPRIEVKAGSPSRAIKHLAEWLPRNLVCIHGTQLNACVFVRQLISISTKITSPRQPICNPSLAHLISHLDDTDVLDLLPFGTLKYEAVAAELKIISQKILPILLAATSLLNGHHSYTASPQFIQARKEMVSKMKGTAPDKACVDLLFLGFDSGIYHNAISPEDHILRP